MTYRLSTGARNFLAKGGSIDRMLLGGRIEIYSGAQPTSPDAAVTGTLLATITAASGAYTAETLAVGSLTLAGGAGSLNTLTVDSINILGGVAIPFDGTLDQTCADVVAQINRATTNPDYSATYSGAGVIQIAARPGTGTTPNGKVVAATATTLTATTANMAGGIAAVNGLAFDGASAGTLPKLATQAWSGVNAASGTAGWFRQYGPDTDAGALDAAGVMLRMDGAVATAGGEMNFNSTAFTAGATTTIAAFSITVPGQ